MIDLLVRDETMTGREIDSWVLPGLPELISARELVRLRVQAHLGGADWQIPAEEACAAFERTAFVMLAGGRQIEDLDEWIDLRREPAVAFIRLVPLVGG